MADADPLEELENEDILVELLDRLGEFDDAAVTAARESAIRRYGTPEKAIAALTKDFERVITDCELHLTGLANLHGPKIEALLQLQDEAGGGGEEDEDGEEDE